MKNTFMIEYDELPVSVNNYLKPTSRMINGKPVAYLYETKNAKDFKKRFKAYLKREIGKQKWEVEQTKDGHWILECVFVQARTNQDNNNYYKILCDSLTEAGVINDDRNILVQTKRVLYDSKNPRFYALLRKADYVGIFNTKESYNNFIKDNCNKCKKDRFKCSVLKKALEGRLQEDDEIIFENDVYKCVKRKQ